MSSGRVFQLKCAVQNYAWGKPGSKSEVASLSKSGDPNFDIETATPYAELWMGTHPKGPSAILETGELLSTWLQKNESAIGDKVIEKFPGSGQLPFLFKVLSVNKSLSVQAHPNKVLAEKLHAEKPDKYPDPNHKPEMAIALTPFEGLCGFRPKDEIVQYMNTISEFKEICGVSNADALKAAQTDEEVNTAVKKCFSNLMVSSADVVRAKVEGLAAKLSEAKLTGENTEQFLGDLFLRLNTQFPGECGCFCIYFMNRMLLQPGEAMFLEANLPHAYLSGDCLECMACSDNVVRAGLTPKFKDVDTLCSMLNYSCKPASENLFPSMAHSDDPCVTLFDPPIDDFSVMRIQTPSGTQTYNVQPTDSGSILLVISGEATGSNSTIPGQLELRRGVIIFISAGESLELNIKSDSMLLFRAYCRL